MEHIELKQLINMCVKGDIQIGKPIILTSKDRSQTTKVSFLNHLLKYNDIKQEKIFTLYFQILNIFNKSYEKLMKNKIFNEFIQHIKKEWDVKENILYKYDTGLNKSRKTIEELLENMNILCRQFRELNGKVRTNNMNDVIVEDEMIDGMDTFLDKVRELSGDINNLSNILDPIIEDINNLNIGTLLDLSMKDKSIYLEYSNINSDNNIPENINISFLNYIYILNLIKKHIIYYRRILSKVKDISDNMSKYVEESKETIKSKDNLYMINRQQEDIDTYLDGLGSEIDLESNIQENDLEDINNIEEDN
tara:strand:- start:2443 stop:3363 length:921 start_codon:yes stop_codon:yes gene_type:complete